MDILEFLQRSEWPIVVGGTLWYFRTPLARLLDHLRPTKISALGVSLELALDKAEALTEETRGLAEEQAPRQLEKPQGSGTLLTFQLPEYEHPQLVVLKSWSALESEIYRASGKSEPTPGIPSWVPMRVMEQIARDIGLTHDEFEAIRELRKVRNRVAHEIEFPLSRAEAMRFVEITRDLILRIRALKPNGGAPGRS